MFFRTRTVKDTRLVQLLVANRKTIELSLRDAEAGLFESRGGIVLYDVTNTHFEGLCAKNPKARHGKNKQKPNDCRQIAIGMALDQRGLPLAHEVFEGNISDTKPLIHMPDRLRPVSEPSGGVEKPLVILDAGFASKANLALLKDAGRIERAIGRLQQKHPRAARFCTLRHAFGRYA